MMSLCTTARRYRGTTITNSMFNGGATLQLAPNVHATKSLDPTDPMCQYWRGAVCSLIITNNHFLCAAADTCATIDVQIAPPQARMIFVESNAFEGPASAVCTAPASKHGCASAEACRSLFDNCTMGG
jgi:hypothetical protein